MTIPYDDFLATKRFNDPASGHLVALDDLSPVLFPFQRALVRWALARGRAGLFAHTGLGKGLMALEWTKHIEGPVLILAPLAVTHQLVREARDKLAMSLQYVRHPEQITQRVVVTNYDLMRNFYGIPFAGIVLDESSRLKHVGSATLEECLTHLTHIPYRLCCTATPAPNDIAEIGNHAEFLGVMKRTDMLSTFFVHDETGWRLRGHAKDAFYQWLASWSMMLRSPEDIGFPLDDFALPRLTVTPHILPATFHREGELFAGMGLKGISDRTSVRRQTLIQRSTYAAELARASDGPVTIWVDLDQESAAVASHLDTAEVAEIYGRFPSDQKETLILSFVDGAKRILLTKPKIAGFGLNFQHAHTAIFVGLTDSWETWFQTIRRLWRYGQTHPVTVHVVLSEHEVPILENVMRKEKQAETMIAEMVEHMQDLEQAILTQHDGPPPSSTPPLRHHTGPSWDLWEGDCVEGLRNVEPESVALTVSSPPFLALYQYSASERDLGNSPDQASFFAHLRYVSEELMRVTLPGRHVAWHVAQVPAMLVRDGWIGLKDFRGELVRHMIDWGWLYHGEIAIDKNPQPLRDGTPVKTPQGWQPIESLERGDEVIGANGKATQIRDIPYRGIQPLYRVHFDDGGFVECGPGHLWTVRSSSANAWRTITLTDMLCQGLRTPSGHWRYEIPLMTPMDEARDDSKLPLHPQLVGALLADGQWSGQRGVSLTKDRVLVESLPLPQGHHAVLRPGSERANGRTMTYGLISETWHTNAILDALRALGLASCRAWEKFIPDIYLEASLAARRSLLTGLLNGDGKITHKGGIWYRTTSYVLGTQVVKLVQSLGGLATMRYREGGRDGDGQQGRPLYEISIRLAGDWCPFTLERKAQYWTNHRRHVKRHIIAIEFTGEAPCTCITVAAPDGLFVTKDYIVTHNSQAIRTHSKGLLFVQMKRDASWLRPALLDYICLFRKPGENPTPILPTISNAQWIQWAHGVWYDVTENDTLNGAEGREEADDRHICPLQLPVIDRCIRLWSNPDELICDPFSGIGSTGYVALQQGRRSIGCELKPSYAQVNRKNLERAISQQQQQSLSLDFS